MKNFKLFEKCNRRIARRVTLIAVLLAMCIPQMWAWDCGWWDSGSGGVIFTLNGSNKTGHNNLSRNNSSQSDLDLGTYSTGLTIKSAWGKTWGKAYEGESYIYSMWLYYRVKVADAASDAAYSEYQIDWDNDFNGNNSYWSKSINTSPSIDGLAPGNYEIEYYMKVYPRSGHYAEFQDLNNGGNNYHANFTIPSRNLTVNGTANGNTVDGSVTGVAKGTAYTITATPVAGYKFNGWTTSNSSIISIADASSPTTTVTFNNLSGNATVKATFVPTYGFIEGRFKVKNAARSTTTYIREDGLWQTSSRAIPMQLDGTNHRFYLHTYCTPAQLAELIGTQTGTGEKNPYFFVSASTASGSVTSPLEYWATSNKSNNDKLLAAGTAGRKAVRNTSGYAFTFMDNSTSTGYAIIYSDKDYIWYELEHDINYNANGGSGDAPTPVYFNNGTEATVAANSTYSKSGYKFKWWNTNSGGTGEDFYPEEKFTISANTDLYAQWEQVSSGWAYWVGDVAISSVNTNYDVTGNGATMQILRESDADWNPTISESYNQVSKYSSTAKKAKVLAIDKDNSYIEIKFKDGSTINDLYLGITSDQTSAQNFVVCYSTTADFSTGEYEFVKVGSTNNVVSVPGHDQATKSTTHVAPSTTNKYKYVRIYRKLTNGTGYNSTGSALGCSNKARIYSIKAQKGSSCTENPTVEAGSNSSVEATTATVTCASGISSLGSAGCEISDYGFVVGTSTGPVIGGSGVTKHQVGTTDYTSTGTSFYKDLTGLTAGTTYYVRPYATNGNGTAYGTETYFTTSTVTMTPTLTNVTHTSGATSGIGGSNYTAVFTANTGYSMPNPTVTIGGNAATIVTDYTWSVEGAVGTITIPANKINGNIVITLNSAAAAPSSVAISGGLLYFAGETIELTATPTGGNGPVTYQWYKGGKADGNAIKGATNATYTKASCAFGDAGSYYCKVTCGGSQSTWGQSGNAYDVKIPRLYVKTGHNNDLVKPDYGNVDFTRATASTATASIVLGSNGDYCFNIADGCGHYYGNSGTMQYNNTGWITNVSPQDCGLTTTNAGTYIFTINYSTWSQLTTTITFPSCTDPGLAFASASKSVTLCDDAPTNALTNTHGVTVSYESSDETVATVASDGTLTIKKAGTTTITASSLEQTVSAVTYCADNASYTLTVNASTAAGLAYGTSTIKKDVGDDAFTNTLTNSNGLTVTYTSSNEDVATIDSDGEVTIKAAGTTTITASSDQQKITSTCYAAGEVSYTLTVYPVYTVTYNAMGGTCSPTSTNTTTALGKVTLPSATHASYTTYSWVTSDGTEAGDAGDTYTPEGNINLYAKWSGSCAGGGATTIYSLTSITGVGSGLTTSGANVGTSYDASSYCTLNSGSDGVYVCACNASSSISSAVNLSYNSTYDTWSFSDNKVCIALYSATGFAAGDKITWVEGEDKKNSPAFAAASASTLDDLKNTNYYSSKATYQLTMASVTTPSADNSYTYIGKLPASFVSSNWLIVFRNGSSFTLKSLTVTRGGDCYTVTYHGNGSTSGYTNDPAQHTAGSDVTVKYNDPTTGFKRTGYDFIGWADGTDHRDAGTVDYQPGDIIEDISSDVTLYAIWKQIKYFKGTSSSSWNTDGNWSPSGVPARTDPVVIQANVMVDTDEAKALSVDIESGNTLTIGAGKALIIEKTLTKAGGATAAADVIINSTREEGTGALVMGSHDGSNAATVNFETKVKRESGTGNWINQFIGSPFSDLEPYVDYALQIYEFRPANDGNRGFWHKLSSGDGMEAFWGYNVLYNDNNYLDVQWTGTLNASSNNETKTGSNAVQTDNLFANSWVAPIHIAAFEEGDFTNFDPTIYIFNAGTPQQEQEMSSDVNDNTATGTYATIPINSSSWLGGTLKVIPAMQAFFVKATGASPSIKLDYSKLVYTPALTSVDITPTRAPRRSAEVAPEVIRLHVAGENGWAENTYVLGREDFTEGYDRGWDGRYMEGEDTNPQLYTPTTDGYMAVNCVPEIEGTVVGFRKGSSDNNYIFSFDYDGDEVWYLNDQKAQKSTQIMNGQTYAFESEAGDNAARFVISATPINKIATGCESVGAEAAKVRKVIIDDKVYIIRGGQVFDVLGKTIKK